MDWAAFAGKVVKDAVGSGFEELTGIPTGGGARNISTATASNAVSVNPAITVISGGGTANPSTSGSATASPSTSVTANNPFNPLGGYGAGRPPTQAEVDVGSWQSQLAGPSTPASILDGVPDWLLIGGAGLAAFMFMQG